MSKKLLKRTAALSALVAVSLCGTVAAATVDNYTLPAVNVDSIDEFKTETGFLALTDKKWYCNYYAPYQSEASNTVATTGNITYSTTEAQGTIGILGAYSGKGTNAAENPSGNILNVKHNVTAGGSVYLFASCINGGADAKWNAVAKDNTTNVGGDQEITIKAGSHVFIGGALSNDGSKADANYNTAVVKNVKFDMADGKAVCIYGGESRGGDAIGNTAIVENVTAGYSNIFGGFSWNADGDASENTVTLNNVTLGEDAECAGGLVLGVKGNADKNIFNINGGKVAGIVYGGYTDNGTASDNIINVSGNANIADATLSGDNGGEGTGNTLNLVEGWTDKEVGTVQNFNIINVEKGVEANFTQGINTTEETTVNVAEDAAMTAQTIGAEGKDAKLTVSAKSDITVSSSDGNTTAISAAKGASVIVDNTADITINGAVQAEALPKGGSTISLKGDDVTITAKTVKPSETEGALRNASIEATGKVTINADGLSGVGGGADKATMAQSINSIKAKEINITSTTAFGVYANDHSYHTVGTRVHNSLEAETINITSQKDGIYASNGAVTEVTGFKTLNVTSEEQGIGSEYGTLTFVGGDMTVTSAEEGIRSKLGGDLDFQVDTLKVNAGLESIKLTGDSIMNVDAKTAQLTGDITLEDINDNAPELHMAFNGKDSYLNGKVTTSENGITDLAFNNGATWNVTGTSSVSDLAMAGGTINQMSTGDVTINNLTGEGNVVFTENSGQVNVLAAESGSKLNLSMAGTNADSFNTNDDLNKVAEKLDAAEGAAGNLTGNVYVAEGLLNGAINMTVDYQDLDGDGLLNGVIKDVTQTQSTTVTAVSGIAANAAVAWRDEDATFSQRLGELRSSEGSQGVWARFTQGEFERGSDFETEYNMFQIGYDKAKGDWHYGVAVSHNEGDTTYKAGNGEFDSTSLSAYGTWLGERGHYKDIVAKIGVIDNEYSINAANQLTKGDYDTVGTSLSAEYGMKNELTSGWYVTPLAKMSYLHIGSADYTTNNGIQIKHKSVDSLIARLGVELGKELGKRGNLYLKASALHDFAGDADTTLRLGTNRATITDEIGGTWYEVGLGFNYKTSDATYLYADVIKTYGDEIRTPWQWNVGARYSF